MSSERAVKAYDMSSSSWLSTIWTRLRREVIQDVPPSLEACESCREVDCARERWLSCARRLAGEAERLAEEGVSVCATARSGEMFGVSSPALAAATAVSDDGELCAEGVGKSASSN